VAGSVAQELITLYERAGVTRAWVNNGGDIALHLGRGASVKVGLLCDLARFDPVRLCNTGELPMDADFEVSADMPVRGIATSGWRGRSFSLGIADSVTVLAPTAAMADAAATVIANSVNIDDPRIERRPASQIKDDTDLGDMPVTVNVPRLQTELLELALARGLQRARELRRNGLIHEAVLVCQHRYASTAGRIDRGTSTVGELGSVFAL
jgi:uncharacterized protein